MYRNFKLLSLLVLPVLLLRTGLGMLSTAQEIDPINELSRIPDRQDLKAQDEITFLEGYVVNIEDNRLTIENEKQPTTLIITGKTRLWKGEVTSVERVESGDYIYARGISRTGEEITATKVWVNIANFYGTIDDMLADGFTLRTGAEDLLLIHIDADTLLNGNPGVDLESLDSQQGQFMQAVGLYQEDGSLHATRLWSSSSRRMDVAEAPTPFDRNTLVRSTEGENLCSQSNRSDYGVQSGVYVGTASWFCCGSGYGPCESTGGGSCGDCESSQYHAAWPKLYRSGYSDCDYSGCGMSLPWKTCGSGLRVRSKCNYQSVWTTVKDCGPAQKYYCDMNVACGSCGSLCSALVDLTPRAFTRIADLDLGRIPVEVHP